MAQSRGHANRNSLVLNSLIISLSFAAFSNPGRSIGAEVLRADTSQPPGSPPFRACWFSERESSERCDNPYRMLGTPQWRVCIVTTGGTHTEYNSIKNSLLYADHTYWISLEVSFKLWRELGDVIGEVLARKGKENFRKELDTAPPRAYAEFKEELRCGGADALMTGHFGPEETIQHLIAYATRFAAPGFAESTNLHYPELTRSVRQMVSGALTESRVVVGESRLLGLRQSWNAHRAAHELMMSVSRLLLPDVSKLPVEAIMEIRNGLQDSLDPVRAEMLRLTEDLRKVVSDIQSQDSLSVEADNLIATRVEPLVRDANRRANELLDRKWRKFLVGAAKAFGFAGAGLADPKLFAKAIQQSLETGALALTEVEDDPTNLKSTSQFVLRARRLASDT